MPVFYYFGNQQIKDILIDWLSGFDTGDVRFITVHEYYSPVQGEEKCSINFCNLHLSYMQPFVYYSISLVFQFCFTKCSDSNFI
jgi:hypothetical protein